MTNAKRYLTAFFNEKEIENKDYSITDSNGFLHIFDNDTLIDRILNTSSKEQEQIAIIIRKIDFVNGSIQHFLNYLAEAMVMQYSKAA